MGIDPHSSFVCAADLSTGHVTSRDVQKDIIITIIIVIITQGSAATESLMNSEYSVSNVWWKLSEI